jgi:hypothetical protein
VLLLDLAFKQLAIPSANLEAILLALCRNSRGFRYLAKKPCMEGWWLRKLLVC